MSLESSTLARRAHFQARSFKPSHQIRALTLSVLFQNFASGLVGLFEPIYLNGLGYSIRNIAIYYVAVYVIYLVILPLGAKMARRFGFVHSIAFSLPIQMAYFLLLALLPIASWLIFVAPIVLALVKTLYWPGYHADLAFYSKRGERGTEVGITLIATGLGTVLGPLVGGAIATVVPFPVLFIIASIVMGIGTIPLFQHREQFTPTPITYWAPWRALKDRALRRVYLSMAGYSDEAITIVFWPIFFLMIGGSLFNIGAIMAGSSILILGYGYLVGRRSDRSAYEAILRPHTLLLSLSWIVRIFVPTPLGSFIGLSASGMGKEGAAIPLYAGIYEIAQREHTVARVTAVEMALVISKIITFLAVIIITFFTSDLRWILMVAPIGTLWYLWFKMPHGIKHEHAIDD